MTEMRHETAVSVLRRTPKQMRSRDRIDEILKVAMELIGRKGIDAVTMKEIAALSGGPIASVYQYFPNKSAIIAILYERHVEKVRSHIAETVKSIRNAQEAVAATQLLTDIHYATIRAHPSTLDMLNAIRADKALASLDIEETQYQAQMYFDATQHLIQPDLRLQYRHTAYLMFHLGNGAIWLALMSSPDEGDRIIEDFKKIATAQLLMFMKGDYRAVAG